MIKKRQARDIEMIPQQRVALVLPTYTPSTWLHERSKVVLRDMTLCSNLLGNAAVVTWWTRHCQVVRIHKTIDYNAAVFLHADYAVCVMRERSLHQAIVGVVKWGADVSLRMHAQKKKYYAQKKK
jgi:hypothetical protein